ncbi:hypothetical protein [Cytobacillus dafuensis]|uniref:Preprotein translocase subunit Tim44 n=1 Tax=Cytobacillus dafuensis TaxID=1742359 RepID=A0A5B8Z4F7_CYTDA|nr:hypothetical protein [Cytobacillus dafuensis]QED46509.1 hypothetical protein FSZ17_04050 [Cytobacillus dafuensis]
MFKKIIASLMVLSLCLAPVTSIVNHNPHVVSAKSYKSGKKSYNSGTHNNSSFYKKDTNQQVNKQKTTTNFTKKSKTTKSSKSGFLKGLAFGGLAGLLFGGLLGNLGVLGSILGLFINIMAIMALVLIIRKVFTSLKRKRRDNQTWER